MNIIAYTPQDIRFEANTEEESNLLVQVKRFLQTLVPASAIGKTNNDFLDIHVGNYKK